MSKKSKEARRKRREAVVGPFLELLSTFQASSLIHLFEAATVSPTAAHRGPSLGRLFFDTVKLWPEGQREATAADLARLTTAAATRDPDAAALEDYMPLDPRLEVRTDWEDQSYRLLPGGLERPVAMFERARMVAGVTHEPLTSLFGFSISDLAQLVLARLDEAATQYSTVWTAGVDRPSVFEVPEVSELEIQCARSLSDIRGFISRWQPKSGVAQAFKWATRDLAELRLDPSDGNSMFGPVLAVQRPDRLLSLPTGFWPDAFDASLIHLAHEAACADPMASSRFVIESQRAFRRFFTMSELRPVGPFSLPGQPPTVFALLVDQRTVLLLDVIAVLDAFDPLANSAIASHFEALRGVGAGAVLSGPSGQLRLHDTTHIARALIVSGAGHVVIGGHPSVAAASLDDLKWIASKTKEAPRDIFYFFDELANRHQSTRILAFETINVFEHWRSNSKAITRQGTSWDAISIEPHRGDAEWDEAAGWIPIENALRVMRFSPLRTWDGYERHQQWPCCSFGMFPEGPLWEIRFLPPLVAVQCFGSSTPHEEREALVNLAESLHWKIERSVELQTALAPLAEPTGVRIIFTRQDAADGPAVRLVRASLGEVELAVAADISNRILADAAGVEHDLADAIATGLREGSSPSQKFDVAAFVSIYDAAPPGLRSEAYELPVRGQQLPEPIEPERAAISASERELAQSLKERGVTPGRYEGTAATQLESEQIAPILRRMLEKALAPFEREQLREFALRQLERCLCSKWSQARVRRQNEQFPVLAYDPVEHEVAEEQASQQLTRLVTLVAEEAVLDRGAGGNDSLTTLAWVRLLAIAHLLMDSYIRSENNHYGLVPTITNIDSMYSITQERIASDASLFDHRAFLDARARNQMRSGRTESRKDLPTKALLEQTSNSLFDAYGYHLEAVIAALDLGRYWDLQPGEEIRAVSIAEFLNKCDDLVPDVPRAEVHAAVKHLLLKLEHSSDFIEHWELERRQIRLMTRPFVEAGNDRFFVLPWQCDASRRVFLGYLSQGRMIWADGDATPLLRKALEGIRETRNKGLEMATEEEFKKVTPRVKRNVKKPGVLGLDSLTWAGEIDCIAAVESRSTIWVADAKDPFATFSPTTIVRSIHRFNGADQYVDKLLKKTAVVSSHSSVVANALGASNPTRAWSVKPLMVTRFVEPAAFARNQRVEFCTVSEIENLVGRG